MAHSPCTIRPATSEDCTTILRFIHELASYEQLADQVVASESGLRDALFHSPTPHAFALIAEQNGTPIGFALYFYSFSTFLGCYGIYLEDLYVQETHRGQGIGKALLQHIAQIAVAQQCGRMEWSVLDWNQPAIDVYRRIGAKPTEGWTMYRLSGNTLQEFAQQAA